MAKIVWADVTIRYRAPDLADASASDPLVVEAAEIERVIVEALRAAGLRATTAKATVTNAVDVD